MHSIGDYEKIVYDFKDCKCVSVLCGAYIRAKNHDVPRKYRTLELDLQVAVTLNVGGETDLILLMNRTSFSLLSHVLSL